LKDFGAGIGFASKAKEENMDEVMKSTIQSALKKAFSTEFLNRLDDVVVFNSLTKEDIHKIIDISLTKLFSRIIDLGDKTEWSESAKDYLSEKGYGRRYGARPRNRAIQKYREDAIAEEILKGELCESDVIYADYLGEGEELTLAISKKENAG